MMIRRLMVYSVLAVLVVGGWTAGAQVRNAPPEEAVAPDYSGMYNFLKEGEFVQVTVEKEGHVTGFVSRYGDAESDRGVFLDHFFKEGKLDGNRLTFATETVHGVAYEFRGAIERGEGRTPGAEAYYVLKGTLIENSVDEGKKTSSRSREVALKSFPRDLGEEPAEKKK